MKKIVVSFLFIIIIVPFCVSAESITSVEFIKNVAGNADKNVTSKIANTDLAYDNTIDNNLRYIGEDPNNYILFNNELWRIVGVMNNVTDYNGNKKSLLKIVRSESIGMIPVCNSSNDCTWNDSILMDVLENYYFNKKEYSSTSDDSSITHYFDFMQSGIDTKYRDYIEKVRWDLGEVEVIKTPKETYEYEHNTNQSNDNIWYGKVGLISGSDYGFAQFPEDEEQHNNCLLSSIYDWDSSCSTSNYLYNDNTWVLSKRNSPTGMGNYNGLLSMIYNSLGNGPYWTAFQNDSKNVFPAVYLKADTIITSGTGTIDNPFKIVNGIKENNYKLNIYDKKKIIDVLSELKNVENVNFKIANDEILKIDSGMIIPLKVGTTYVEFDYDDVHYLLHISILDQGIDNLINPKTETGFYVLILFIILIGFMAYIILKRKKNYIMK